MSSDEIRALQREHLVRFLSEQDFTGRVLDFGCGTAPYREIVEKNGGEWNGYNRGIFPGGSKADIGVDKPLLEDWDVILCTQMLQYVPDVAKLLRDFRSASERLVLTVATNWPEVEVEDLYRFTLSGISTLLEHAGFTGVAFEQIGAVRFGDREWCALGYGVVAR